MHNIKNAWSKYNLEASITGLFKDVKSQKIFYIPFLHFSQTNFPDLQDKWHKLNFPPRSGLIFFMETEKNIQDINAEFWHPLWGIY